jgi:hypothetical protein
MFEFRGGMLIRVVFKEFTSDLEAALIDQVKAGGEAGINFVLCILKRYEGEEFLHDLIKELVCAINPGDGRLEQVEIILDSSGPVWGEFGMRDMYLRKQKEITPWLNDEKEEVRSFAEHYIRSLDRYIAAEQRRAEEEVEMRKREFGDDEED